MATRIRKQATRIITGVEDLDKKLEALKAGAANKIARPALTKAARFLLKKVKTSVPPQYKDAKKALGMAVNAKGGKSRNEQQAKVGAGVGIKAAKLAKLSGQQKEKRGGSESRGVGIGAANLHWFILGTGSRKHDSGKSTGQMPPVMAGLVRDATTAARSEMLGIMRTEVMTRLAILARKN